MMHCRPSPANLLTSYCTIRHNHYDDPSQYSSTSGREYQAAHLAASMLKPILARYDFQYLFLVVFHFLEIFNI